MELTSAIVLLLFMYRDISALLIKHRVVTIDLMDEFTSPGKRSRLVKTRTFLDYLMTKTEKEYDIFVNCLSKNGQYEHLRTMIEDGKSH